jgi:hypothetical protein
MPSRVSASISTSSPSPVFTDRPETVRFNIDMRRTGGGLCGGDAVNRDEATDGLRISPLYEFGVIGKGIGSV